MARSAHEAGEFSNAIRYYTRAVQLAPYLHEAHLGLAQPYYESGSLRNAERALEAASESAQKVSVRSLYEAKLLALRQEF